MAEGEVGGGHQNQYKNQGTIFRDHLAGGTPLTFEKGKNPNPKRWKENVAWTAGTPVTWEDGQHHNAEAVTAKLGDVEMLVTKIGSGQSIQEYHPLTTFFNIVLARIQDDSEARGWLMNLSNPNNAQKLWQYLESKYGPLPEARTP